MIVNVVMIEDWNIVLLFAFCCLSGSSSDLGLKGKEREHLIQGCHSTTLLNLLLILLVGNLCHFDLNIWTCCVWKQIVWDCVFFSILLLFIFWLGRVTTPTDPEFQNASINYENLPQHPKHPMPLWHYLDSKKCCQATVSALEKSWISVSAQSLAWENSGLFFASQSL